MSSPILSILSYKGDWKEAYEVLAGTNNFPEFTGRTCPAPCEPGCVLGLIKDPVTIKEIELAIIEKAFEEGWIKPAPPKQRTGKSVAIVGSGPAGLAAAAQLNKAGHTVSVYERDDRIGGLLRYGIPDFKMDKRFIDRRVDILTAEGIHFKTNAGVGSDIDSDKLVEENDAVIIACGATMPMDIKIKGRHLEGIHYAMDFLMQSNRRVAGDTIPEDEEISAKGKHVLVVGGGDTGSDCVGTSMRQGAKSVTMIRRSPKPSKERPQSVPWPLDPVYKVFTTSTSEAEGCLREWGILTKEFLTDNNSHVTGARYVRLDWQEDGMSKEAPGENEVYKADIVFLAMGYTGPERVGIVEQLDLETDDWGNVITNDRYETSTEKVFAAGDMRIGQSLVVTAISEGRECAREVDKALSGGVTRLLSKNQFFSKTS